MASGSRSGRRRWISPDGVTTMGASVARVMAPWRFSAWTFTVFALLAFALAVVGLFGVVALDVGHRQHELAIRLAVGAPYADLLRCVLVPAGWKVVAGAALGLGAAAVGARAIRSLLFGVGTIDPSTYVSVVLLVLVVVTTRVIRARAPDRTDRSGKIVDAAVKRTIYVILPSRACNLALK
jgi:hypothetical protein